MFEAVGFLDSAKSIAAWRQSLPHWSTPEFTPSRKVLHVEALFHPLLPCPVSNDLRLDDRSALITGSNMSGKSTLVRALGVSALLARTVHTTCARGWRAPALRVRTSIGRSDSVTDGRSYYLAEAEAVLELIRARESEEQHLFILDELFRGTNTTERVAAAYAVLAHLTRGLDLVVATTHDLELLDLLGDSYEIHHFREQIVGDSLTFDYMILPGPSTTRNAIALLKLMHYPDSVVADALASIDWSRQRDPARMAGEVNQS